MFWSLCPMNRFTDYVCKLFVWTFILNRWILTCCQLHLYRLFQFFFLFFFFIYPPEYSLPSFYTRLIFKSNDRFFAFPVFHKKIFPAYTHYPLTIFHSLVTWLNQNLARYLMYHFSTCTIFKTRPEFNPSDSTNERISIFHTVRRQISRKETRC